MNAERSVTEQCAIGAVVYSLTVILSWGVLSIVVMG
jgi:hypothetical protein